MKKNYKKILSLAVVLMSMLSIFPIANAQVQKKTMVVQKSIKTFDCTYCLIEKKNPHCFVIQSYIGSVLLEGSKKNSVKIAQDFNEQTGNASVTEYYYCAIDGYTEITVSADNYLPTIVALTPYDFKTGVPVISIYDASNAPSEDKSEDESLTVFEKMDKLEKAEAETPISTSKIETKEPQTAEKEIFMYKEYSKAVCDYCFEKDKKARCFMILTSLKGAKLMDETERIPHTKALRIKDDSTRQYIFCFRPDKYKQYLLKAKGYQTGVVEIIPSDFANNQTPVLTFLNEDEKETREGKTEVINKLYTEKHPERWDCEECKNNSKRNSCLYIYSSLPNLLLNNETEIISPQEVQLVGSELKRYSFCVSPTTRTLMVSSTGYEPSLLKLKFDDLETLGATAFIVSDDESGFADIKTLMEADRTPVAVPKPQTMTEKPQTSTGLEFRVQLIAKIQGDSDAKKMQKELNLPYELKEDYDGKWYRFTAGTYPTYKEALDALKEFNKKTNTSDSFIVLYSNGKRVGPYVPKN